MKTISAQLIILVSFFIYFSPFVSAQRAPEDIVKQFCAMRFDGSAYKNFNDYQKLTVWGPDYDEPGWDIFFVVDTFSVLKTRLYGYVAYVDVNYHSYGMYEGDKFVPNDTSETRQYILFNTYDGWKIYNTGENPRISLAVFLKDANIGLEDLYKVSQIDNSNKEVNDEYTKMYNERKKLIADLKLIEAKRNRSKH